MDPQLRRAETFDALRRLLLRAAEVRPQVVVFEDLHWMDQATEAFLTFTMDSIPTSRVLCLLTYRPGYVHPLAIGYHTRLVLPTLSSADTVQMARPCWPPSTFPRRSRRSYPEGRRQSLLCRGSGQVPARDGGHAGEGDRYVLARPLDETVVPDTIQDVLMARIDRLEEAPKKTCSLPRSLAGSSRAVCWTVWQTSRSAPSRICKNSRPSS